MIPTSKSTSPRKNASSPRVDARRIERVPPEEVEIPPVRAKGHVVEVAEQRDRADAEVDDQVRDHAAKHHLRDAEPRGLEDDPRADQCGECIAGDRDEADQRVETDLDRRSGHGHEFVEHPRDAPDALLGSSELFGP